MHTQAIRSFAVSSTTFSMGGGREASGSNKAAAIRLLTRRRRLLVARNCHATAFERCLLLRDDRTCRGHRWTDAIDPNRKVIQGSEPVCKRVHGPVSRRRWTIYE